MKKWFTVALMVLLCCITCTAFAACGKVEIDEISITAPASIEIAAGETFKLEYKTVPEEATEKVKVNWKISDSKRLSYKNGEFTALTCGTVTVTAAVKGSDVTDEIKLTVTAPAGFSEYSGTGYQLVYPSSWTANKMGNIQTWTASNGTTNMNISTEALNAAYFTSSASAFQSVIQSTYTLAGYTVNFTKPVKVKKSKYLGVSRVQVDYDYTLTVLGTTSTLHQTQMIFNNADANLSCVLTLTYRLENYNEAAQELQKTILNQFLPK